MSLLNEENKESKIRRIYNTVDDVRKKLVIEQSFIQHRTVTQIATGLNIKQSTVSMILKRYHMNGNRFIKNGGYKRLILTNEDVGIMLS
jgi:DNA-directed RNA polymerase specialized sigma subunit